MEQIKSRGTTVIIEELQHGGKGSGKGSLKGGKSAGCRECVWVGTLSGVATLCWELFFSQTKRAQPT